MENKREKGSLYFNGGACGSRHAPIQSHPFRHIKYDDPFSRIVFRTALSRQTVITSAIG